MNKKNVLPVMLMMAIVLPLSAYRWPVNDPVVEASFGQEEGGSFLTGALVGGSGAEVMSVEDGRVVYYHDNTDSRNRLPSGIGSFAVLEHARGIRSFYGNLEDLLVSGGDVGTGQVIGRLSSGAGGEKQPLFLQVLDYQFYRYVNPLLSLPLLADTEAPDIREVVLRKGRVEQRLRRDTTVDSGIWKVFVAASDPAGPGQRAPHRFGIYLNGEAQGQIALESIEVSGQDLILNRVGNVSASQLFELPGYFRVAELRLSPGASTLEVEVSDFAGNQNSRSFLLRVR